MMAEVSGYTLGTLHLEPGDLIVVSLDHNPRIGEFEGLRERLTERFPGHPIAILAKGITLDAMPADDARRLLEELTATT